METSVQLIFAVAFFIMGVSHVVRPRAWAEFFILLRGKGPAGNFVNAFIHLFPGLLIIGFHNVWTGIPTVLTVLGWLYVLKSFLYFAFPNIGLRSLDHVSVERSGMFVVAGVMLLVLSALLFFALLTGGSASLAAKEDPAVYGVGPECWILLSDFIPLEGVMSARYAG